MESNIEKIECIKKNECSYVNSLFGKYFKKELSDEERRRLIHHLAVCRECRKAYLDYYNTARKLF